MNHLVEKATQLASLESKQVELDRIPPNIRGVIERALESAKKVLNGHPVELQTPGYVPLVGFELAAGFPNSHLCRK